MFGYGDPRGSAALREVLAAYLRRVRGAVADPERLVICSGFAQGLNLILRALARTAFGRWRSRPGDLDQPAIAARAGLQAVPVRVDQEGVDVASLAASDARAVVLTPAHQSPTGVVLAPSGGRRWSPGPTTVPRSSRTTTTPSSATTANWSGPWRA